ncbi:Tricalbin [Phytophthora palmivora]|uniref:Tricalbin n=1 Tax=Phytophthora palmivora TaxID=4796 RepID=A0A2P4YR19_9STRA|nr:Tricalbin [Phytophthora palmivora]
MASLGGVRVNVVEARGILAADAGGTSDPYVTITLLDSKGSVMAAGGTFKTAVIKKTLTPRWDETFVVGDKLDLRVVTTLRLLLSDSDGAFYSDDVLGVVDIPVTLLLGLREPLDNWFQLTKHEKMKKDSRGELRVVLERLAPEESMAGRGTGVNIDPGLETKPPAVSTEPPNLLYVTLKSGKNLLGMDNNGTTSDPIVFLTYNGQKHESTKKEKTLRPQWNEKFGFFAQM